MTLTGLTSGALDRDGAVRVDGRSLSGADIRAAARAVAHDLAGTGVVAVHATPTIETVVAIVGALMAGVAVVPLPPDAGTAERAHLLADSGATTTVTVDVHRRSAMDVPPVDPGRTALIMYTSGTTGPPKGVVLSHAALAAGIDGLVDAWDWTAGDVLVHGLPLFHVHGLVLGLLGPLRVGSPLIHTGRPTPEAYAAERGSLYFGVPTVWSRICAQPAAARALAPARLLVSGSAPLPVPTFERLRALTGHRPIERYGMTETLITLSSRADGERRAGYVGFPITGVTTRLVDDAGAAVPHDGESIGELQVRGPMLSSGYWRRPAATAASRTVDGWFRTGDIASIDAAGWHRIVGRASTDLIKCGGYRIGAGEVEDALLAHPAVREAAVIGVPDADLGELVVAFVVADGVGERELTEFVGAHLSAHKRPRRITFLAELPRNAMGKVQKGQLTDRG
jgi:fatty acid CoA ligase FadD36